MKIRVFKHAAILLVLAVCTTGCGKNEIDIPIPLKGTKWRLVGIIYVYDRPELLQRLPDPPVFDEYFRILEPDDCEECYTLTFNSNYTAISFGVDGSHSTVKLDLRKVKPSNRHIMVGGPAWIERYNGNDYVEINDFKNSIIAAESFSVTRNELKLFFCFMCPTCEATSYLLFKPL